MPDSQCEAVQCIAVPASRMPYGAQPWQLMCAVPGDEVLEVVADEHAPHVQLEASLVVVVVVHVRGGRLGRDVQDAAEFHVALSLEVHVREGIQSLLQTPQRSHSTAPLCQPLALLAEGSLSSLREAGASQ